MDIDRESFQKLLHSFKEIGKAVHHERVIGAKVPLMLVINSAVQAFYQALSGGVLSKMILSGETTESSKGLSPSEKILRREAVAYEILKVIAEDLEASDPKHEYSIGFAKRERKRSKK